jgi:hypothetical protein
VIFAPDDIEESNVLIDAYEACEEEIGMTLFKQGTVLTCEHEECGCRVRIDEECHCPSGSQSYTCACGTPMVVMDDARGVGAGTE